MPTANQLSEVLSSLDILNQEQRSFVQKAFEKVNPQEQGQLIELLQKAENNFKNVEAEHQKSRASIFSTTMSTLKGFLRRQKKNVRFLAEEVFQKSEQAEQEDLLHQLKTV